MGANAMELVQILGHIQRMFTRLPTDFLSMES